MVAIIKTVDAVQEFTVQQLELACSNVRHEQRRRELRIQLWLVLVLNLFAGSLLLGPLVAENHLSHDRLRLFSLFRDTLHSINTYGDYPWWNPAVQLGFPFYFLTILAWTQLTPMFSVVCGGAWFLGRLGVTPTSWYLIYVVYIGFLVPLLLSLSVLALTRQLVRSTRAVRCVIVFTAFSPGVVFSISDSGVELTAYGVFALAAALHFIRHPSRSRFVLMSLACFSVCLSLNHLTLYWNALFLPSAVLLACCGRRGIARHVRQALRTVRTRAWLGLLAGVILCISPALVTYSHGTTITRDKTGTHGYQYTQLRPGNPLEFLSISTPGVGYEWDNITADHPRFTPYLLAQDAKYGSYGYMGVMALPLVLIGLAYGRRQWRLRLIAGVAIAGAIWVLSGWSPIFSVILAWPTPLQAVNHYSDTLFRMGAFIIYLLAIGMGAEVIARSARIRRRVLPTVFALSVVPSSFFLIILNGRAATSHYIAGFFLFMIVLYSISLTQVAHRRHWRWGLLMLLVLSIADLSTNAFAHSRFVLRRHASASPNEPPPQQIGMNRGLGALHAQSLLRVDGLDARTLVRQRDKLPKFWFLSSSEPQSRPSPAPVTVTRQSYTHLELDVTTTIPAQLVWRDAYFPFWQATVNGQAVPVKRGANFFKAVDVPPGVATVTFQFTPGIVPWLVHGSQLLILVTSIVWFALVRRDQPTPDLHAETA